jgi:hypothetical protein
VSNSHIKPEFLKTTAPPSVVWDVFRYSRLSGRCSPPLYSPVTSALSCGRRCWERLHPIAASYRDDPKHVSHRLLKKPVKTEVRLCSPLLSPALLCSALLCSALLSSAVCATVIVVIVLLISAVALSQVSFEVTDAVRKRVKGGWFPNPGENWGPKVRQ